LDFAVYISSMIIPLLFFYIVATAVTKKTQVYDDFVEGAEEGLKTVVKILPTLIGLMVGVGILRNSGFLDFLGNLLKPVATMVGFPSELVPVSVVRMFSSSAATGLVLDIFKEHGTDSLLGTTVSIMMSCTETVFYTMSVYYMTAKVSKTRWTLAGALVSTLAGLIASVVLAKWMRG